MTTLPLSPEIENAEPRARRGSRQVYLIRRAELRIVGRRGRQLMSAAESRARRTGSGVRPNQSPLREETTPYCSRQGAPASVVKVPLFENQPLMPMDGPPKNQEKNANSCRS
jgi:hypothetical protein